MSHKTAIFFVLQLDTQLLDNKTFKCTCQPTLVKCDGQLPANICERKSLILNISFFIDLYFLSFKKNLDNIWKLPIKISTNKQKIKIVKVYFKMTWLFILTKRTYF